MSDNQTLVYKKKKKKFKVFPIVNAIRMALTDLF